MSDIFLVGSSADCTEIELLENCSRSAFIPGYGLLSVKLYIDMIADG